MLLYEPSWLLVRLRHEFLIGYFIIVYFIILFSLIGDNILTAISVARGKAIQLSFRIHKKLTVFPLS